MRVRTYLHAITLCMVLILQAVTACSPAIPATTQIIVNTVVVKETVLVPAPASDAGVTPVAPVIITQPANSPAPVAQPASSPPAKPAALGAPMKLVLIKLDSTAPSSGWQLMDAYFALENQSNDWQPVLVDTGPGKVETSEGFSYDVEPVRYDREIPRYFGDPLTIPAGFRIQGSSDNYSGYDNTLRASFRVAAGTHPTRITFEKYGTIDLSATASPNYPTDLPANSFKNLGDSVEIPGKARVTFTQAQRTTYGSFQGLRLITQFQNLSNGYDASATVGCFIIDGQGYIRWNKEEVRFIAGPGQTTEVPLGYYLWVPHKAFGGTLDISEAEVQDLLKNARLVCRGDFEVVLNLSVPSGPVAQQEPVVTSEPVTTPPPAATPPPVATPPPAVPMPAVYEVQVKANQGWQDSGILLQAGMKVTIEYLNGAWFTGANDGGPRDADGGPNPWTCTLDSCHELLHDFPKYALIGRIGENDLLKVGSRLEFTAGSSGELYMRPNYGDQDIATFNPQGSLVVRVTVQ